MLGRLAVTGSVTIAALTLAMPAGAGEPGGEEQVVFDQPGTLDFPVPGDVCEITVTALGART